MKSRFDTNGREEESPTRRILSNTPKEEDRAPAAHRTLTTVTSCYREGQCNHRLLFGVPFKSQVLHQIEGESDIRYAFQTGERFALDLWTRNCYGTIRWRCLVCETLRPGERGDVVPRVWPAVRVLLQTKGAAQSRLFLHWLHGLENQGIDLRSCPPETFEAAHFRLQGLRADRAPPQRLSGLL